MRNVAVKKRYVNGGVRFSFFVMPVGEASPDVVQTALKASYEIVLHDLDKAQARIAELEKQLAERSPGVMPECVKKMVEAAESNHIISYGKEKALAKAVRDYYAPPDGHRWEPVDDANPITAEDVGRMFCWGPTKIEHVFGNGPKFQAAIEGRHILRPVAPPFVFTGEPGWYMAEMDSGSRLKLELILTAAGLMLCWNNCGRIAVHSDGTFDGGRITGRVGE